MARNDGRGDRSSGRPDRDWLNERDSDFLRGREAGTYGRDTGHRRDPGSRGHSTEQGRFDAGFNRPDWENDEWAGWSSERPRRARGGEGPDYRDEFNPREGFARGMTGPDMEWGRGAASGFDRSADYGERGRVARGDIGGGIVPNHSGRGPKNYRRADERVIEDINEALTRDPDIDATDIEVRCEQGEVILVGVVESRRAKRLAEDVAESISGVRDVDNRLKIDRGEERPAAGGVRGAKRR